MDAALPGRLTWPNDPPRAAHHGAYLWPGVHDWRNGPLTDNDGALGAIARLTPAYGGAWGRSSGLLLGCNRWPGPKRMDRERNKWSGISDKRRKAGKAGRRPNGDQTERYTAKP